MGKKAVPKAHALSSEHHIRNSSDQTNHQIKGDNYTESNLQHLFNSIIPDKIGTLTSVTQTDFSENCSIISKFASNGTNYGLFRYILSLSNHGNNYTLPAILKIKAPNEHIRAIETRMVMATGDNDLAELYDKQSHIFNLENISLREVAFYTDIYKKFAEFCPEIYGTFCDPGTDSYIILMEDLSAHNQFDVNADNPGISEHIIKKLIRRMVRIHTVFMDKVDDIPASLNLVTLNKKNVCSACELLNRLTEYTHNRYPDLVSTQLFQTYKIFLDNIESNIETMTQFPLTMVHGDFNPRNFFIRGEGEHGNVVLIDWELSSIQNPQRDLVELLVYVLPSDADRSLYLRYADYYRRELETATGRIFSSKEFNQIVYLNALYFGQVRLNLYLLANNIMPLPYMGRVYNNLAKCIFAFQ